MTDSSNFFTEEICNALAGKLDKTVVRTRKLYGTSGPELSYVEGWWVIQEANRIFGYGNWTQEINDLKCISSFEKDGKVNIGYVCTCTITVFGVKRQDVGYGSGVNKDPGGAHESASKEAVTDAMKRAFRTFGYTFGLALYDKDQANVAKDDLDLIASDKNQFIKFIVDAVEAGTLTTLGRDAICAMVNAANLKAIDEKFRSPILKALADGAKLALINEGKHPKTGVQLIEDPTLTKPEEKIEDLEAAVNEVM